MAAVRATAPAGECVLSGAVASKLLERIEHAEPSLLGASDFELALSDAERAVADGEIAPAEAKAIFLAARLKFMECKAAFRADEKRVRGEIRRRLDSP